MEHLTTLDAGFLEAEDSDRHISLAIGGLSVLEGPMPAFDDLVAGIAERLQGVPRFRQVLRMHRFDLGAPEWVEDPHLDLAHHIHLAAIPHPGDDQALFRFVADVMERRLDRERPLWECWIIEGLNRDRWAILMKIHHCIADGIATMHMVSGLSDGGEGETFAGKIRAAKDQPSSPSWFPRLSLNPLDWTSGAWRLATNMGNAAGLAVEGALEITSSIMRPAAASSLLGPVSTMRRYSAARVKLADVAKVCGAFDVTLNDVALAAVTHSFREQFLRRGEDPKRNSLRTLVPVSVRSHDPEAKTSNQVSVMLPFLPVEKENVADQLRTVHRRLDRTKASGQRQAGTIFIAAVNVLPFPLTAWAVRALTKLPQHGVVTLTTNVPGPRHRLTIMGRTVLDVFPIPPIALQLRTGIAILSYADELVFGITADFDTAPDLDELAQGIEDGVQRLVELSVEPTGAPKD